jgi:hypothetical protein
MNATNDVFMSRPCEVHMIMREPSGHPLKVVFDTKTRLPDAQLFKLIKDLTQEAVKIQEAEPSKGSASLQVEIPGPKGNVYVVFTYDWMVITDSKKFSDMCWAAEAHRDN